MKCERCDERAIDKERFCKDCKKALLLRLEDDGYLPAKTVCNRKFRDASAQENIRETKYGRDH